MLKSISLPALALILAGCASQSSQSSQNSQMPGIGGAPPTSLPLKYAGPPTGPAISKSDLMTRLYIYADDSMQGRAVGTEGNIRATAYIAAEFQRMGLQPAGDNGTYFQDIHTELQPKRPGTTLGPARNVVAILPGSDPVLRNQYVALGAHNDHLGVKKPVDHDSLRAFNFAYAIARANAVMPSGATPQQRAAFMDSLRKSIHVNVDSLRRIRPARADSISNGADDDGTGTVALLEIAEALANAPVKPRRSILFVSHTGEERGLWGSKWYTDHPTVPRDSIVAQLNMDMIGRGTAADVANGGPRFIDLVGSRRLSTELGDVIEAVNSASSNPFKIDYTYDAPGHPEQIYCRSDHAEYARYGIPVAFFFTGLHPDYHQVTDEPQYIDYDKLSHTAQLVYDITVRVGNMDHRPLVDKPKPDPKGRCVQ